MKLFSASDYEPAIIAVGRAPVGIVAIGAFPLGVIAIGGMPMGLVSISAGIALGMVTFSCGVGVGVFGRVVGLGLGGDIRGAGLMLSWAKGFPAAELVSPHRSIPISDALDATGENWVRVELNAEGELHSEEVLFEMDPKAREQLGRVGGHRVYAKVHAIHPAPDERGSFRDQADPGAPYLVCSEIDSPVRATSRNGQAIYWMKMIFVAAVVLSAINIASQSHVEKLTMPHISYLTWEARLLTSTRADLPAEAECFVTVGVFSDGVRRYDGSFGIQCAGVSLAGDKLDDCVLAEVVRGGEVSYRLRCNLSGAPERTDDYGNVYLEVPRLDLDTSARRAVITANGPPFMRITLEVDELGTLDSGEPPEL